MRFLRVLCVLCGLNLFVSCAGIPSHRAAQYRAISSQWDVATRDRLLDARVQAGDTRAMVYVALGVPLKPPVLTDDKPPRERWEYLVYETQPAFPSTGSAATQPLVSMPQQSALRAETINNVVMPNPLTAPPLRLLVVEFGPDDRLLDWRLYPDSQGRALSGQFQQIMMPKSPSQ